MSSDQLVVYIIWIPQWEGDIYRKARRFALRTDDARIKQFVTPTLDIPKAFTQTLSWGHTEQRHASGPTPWDVHLLYSADAVWTDAPTTPVHWGSPTVTDKQLTAHFAQLTGRPANTP